MSNFKEDIENHFGGSYNENFDSDDSDEENSNEKIQMKKIEYLNLFF